MQQVRSQAAAPGALSSHPPPPPPSSAAPLASASFHPPPPLPSSSGTSHSLARAPRSTGASAAAAPDLDAIWPLPNLSPRDAALRFAAEHLLAAPPWTKEGGEPLLHTADLAQLGALMRQQPFNAVLPSSKLANFFAGSTYFKTRRCPIPGGVVRVLVWLEGAALAAAVAASASPVAPDAEPAAQQQVTSRVE